MAEVSPGWDRSSGCARGATHCSLWSSSSRANSTIPKRLSGPQNGPQSIEHGRVLNGRRHSFVAAVGDAAHRLTQNLSRTGLRQRGDDVDDPETRHSADVFPHRLDDSSASRSAVAPALSTTKPRGTWPLISSATPMTAHSATAGWPASTASIDPVDMQCPATFITSSVRPITNR